MQEEIVFAGFGGQGILFAAELLAYAAMEAGREVAWVPSYGPEMRGGTAAATAIIADEPIGSLTIREPGVAAVMNQPSFDKYQPLVRSGGLLVVNASLIAQRHTRADIRVLDVPANEAANRLGNGGLANMVMLGAVLGATGLLPTEMVLVALKKKLGDRKAHLLEIDAAMIAAGMALAREAQSDFTHLPS